jgi:hypothetical protein
MYMLLYVCARSRASERRRLPGEPTPRTRRWCGGRRATAEGRALVPPTVRCAVLVRGARRRRPPGERRRRRRGPDWIFIVVLPAAPDGRPSGRREFVKAPSLGLAGEAGTRREVRRPGASPRRRGGGGGAGGGAPGARRGPGGVRRARRCGRPRRDRSGSGSSYLAERQPESSSTYDACACVTRDWAWCAPCAARRRDGTPRSGGRERGRRPRVSRGAAGRRNVAVTVAATRKVPMYGPRRATRRRDDGRLTARRTLRATRRRGAGFGAARGSAVVVPVDRSRRVEWSSYSREIIRNGSNYNLPRSGTSRFSPVAARPESPPPPPPGSCPPARRVVSGASP